MATSEPSNPNSKVEKEYFKIIAIALNTNTCIYKSTVAYAREVNYGKEFKYRNDYRRP